MSAAEIRAVLFDLDGTLIDTAPDMIAALNFLLGEHDLPPVPYAIARTQVSHGSIGLVRLAFPQSHGEEFELLRTRFLSLYYDRVALETTLFPGCPELLGILEQRSMPWGIVTNKPGFLTAPLLQALHLEQRAACVVSGDTLPERKPHPAPLLHAAALLGVVPAQCIYIGDAQRDMQSARAAGMPVLLASYGYLGPDDEPTTWAADGELPAPLDLLKWLEPIGVA